MSDISILNATPNDTQDPAEDYLPAAAAIGHTAGGSLSPSQIKAIHIISLSCTSLSLVGVLVALRWFSLMRRSFRHQLVMYLIISNTFKALWYFVFSVANFAGGPVESTSDFCQASGFLLAFAIEAADTAIFIIALHSILYVMKPTNGIGEGGLYPYRRWIYLLWLGPPLLAACLAFIHTKDAYVTAGTFCYLPKRPHWYQLALSWVPRYLIIGTILVMYIWIYIYIHVKFRGFEKFDNSVSSYGTDSDLQRTSHPSNQSHDLTAQIYGSNHDATSPLTAGENTLPWQIQDHVPIEQASGYTPHEPWDSMKFISSRHLSASASESVAQGEGQYPTSLFGSAWSGETQLSFGPGSIGTTKFTSSQSNSPRPSNAPGVQLCDAHGSQNTLQEKERRLLGASDGSNDQLKKTRAAIQKQLRYLFTYPLVYILMWSFPFAGYALSYSDYNLMHPIFWLVAVQTMTLSLQAGVDSVIFSWREKPWRRIDEGSRLSLPFLQSRGKAFLKRASHENGLQTELEADVEDRSPPVSRTPHWWEAEGRRRNDSVWLGTSILSDSISLTVTRTRTRSTSPTKPPFRNPHERTRSSEKQSSFTPKLESIPMGRSPSTAQRTPCSPQQATFTSTPGNSNTRIHERSVSANMASPGKLHKVDRSSK